jgi:predicted kinase
LDLSVHRALETACISFQACNEDIPVVAHTGCCEIGSAIPGESQIFSLFASLWLTVIFPNPLSLLLLVENQGRPVRTLLEDKHLSCFPMLWRTDFSQVREQEGEGLWAAPRKAGCRTSAKEASKQMRRWLSTRPEKHIALICHHNFLQDFLGTRDRVENCTLIEYWLESGIVKPQFVQTSSNPTPVTSNPYQKMKHNCERHQEPSPYEQHHIKSRESIGPALIVLVGIRGSGKSTFGAVLERQDFVRICQDEIGSLTSCRELTTKMLRQGKHVVIDSCNLTAEQRALWIKHSPHNTTAVFFDISKDVCLCRLAKNRVVLYGPCADEKLQQRRLWEAASLLEEPTMQEGFNRIHRIQNVSAANLCLQHLGFIGEVDFDDFSDNVIAPPAALVRSLSNEARAVLNESVSI